MRLLILSIFVTCSAAGVAAQAKNDPATGVRQALAVYDAAWNKKDIQGVAAILLEDYVYFTSSGELTDRKRTLEFLASPDYKLTFAERSDVRVLHNDDHTAVIGSRWKGRGTFGKDEINDDQRCGMVFIRRKREWRLLSEHCVQIVSK